MTVTSTMLLTSVIVSLFAWLTRSTPIFIVDERVNIYISLTVSSVLFVIVVIYLPFVINYLIFIFVLL